MKAYKRYKIKESKWGIETNEIFLDALARAKEEDLGVSEKKFEVKIKERIIYAILGIFLVFSTVLFYKVFFLQVIHGKELYALSERNKGKISLITPERGIIYDANMKKLVVNAPAYDVVCDKRNFIASTSQSVREIEILAKVLQKERSELEQQIADSEDLHIVIAENIGQETLLVLTAKAQEINGCKIKKNTVRNYAFGQSFSHILGYMGKITKDDLQNTKGIYASSESIGKVGLEKSYEDILRGIPGKTEVVRDAVGIKRGDKSLSEPQEGYNLVLNINADLQKRAFDSLEKSIKNIGAKKGAAVALNPKNGAVLALVSYPAYDGNIFSRGISKADFEKLQNDSSQPFFNRAISAQYPTGSTIKPFLAAGALQEKIIDPKKLINDPGYILVHSQYDPSVVYKFAGVIPHGLVDMREAIAVSSNIYFFTIGGGYGDQQGLGPGRIKKYLDLFGWEQKTGIDLPNEFKGFVPSPEWKKSVKKENWWDGDTYNLSIGQSDLQVTPLQVAVAYGAIANGGTLYEPRVVSKVINGSGAEASVVEEIMPKAIARNIIDPEYLKIVREGMRDGVRKVYGSSVMLSDLPVPVAGKTGTVETGKEGYYNTWSSNFAPYDDPEIVFVATIEGVQGLRSATLPVTHDVLQWYFSR